MNLVEAALPKQDGLIKEQPSRSMKMAIVVPVYNEYKNGNIFRHMESLARQSAPVSDWEVVFLVNNTKFDVKQDHDGYRDNQECLRMLRSITSNEPIPDEITGYRRTVIQKVIDKKIKIHVIDRSTEGVERNMGELRDSITQEEIRRFAKTAAGENGIIAQMDADTVVEPHYIDKAIKHFDTGEIDTLFLAAKSFNPEGRLKLHQSTHAFQFRLLLSQVRDLQTREGIVVYSPQIIARVKAYKKVGGVPHESAGEDHALSRMLSGKTRYDFAQDINLYMADRARWDSFLGGKRDFFLNEGEFDNPKDPVESWIYTTLRARLGSLATRELRLPEAYEIQTLFDEYGIPFDRQAYAKSVSPADIHMPVKNAVESRFSRYCDLAGVPKTVEPTSYPGEIIEFAVKHWGDESKKLVEAIRSEELQQKIRLSVDRSVLRDAVHQMFENSTLALDSDKMKEFLDMNPELTDELQNVRKLYKNEKDAWDKLVFRYPEWFADYDSSRLRKATAQMQGIVSYFTQARAHPDKYPKTTAYLESFQRID